MGSSPSRPPIRWCTSSSGWNSGLKLRPNRGSSAATPSGRPLLVVLSPRDDKFAAKVGSVPLRKALRSILGCSVDEGVRSYRRRAGYGASCLYGRGESHSANQVFGLSAKSLDTVGPRQSDRGRKRGHDKAVCELGVFGRAVSRAVKHLTTQRTVLLCLCLEKPVSQRESGDWCLEYATRL